MEWGLWVICNPHFWSSMLKPIKIDAYLTYKCLECNEESDMFRVSETKNMSAYTCWYCEHTSKIEPVESVIATYKTTHTEKYVTTGLMEQAIVIVGEYYDNAEELVRKAYSKCDYPTIQALVKESLAQIKDE